MSDQTQGKSKKPKKRNLMPLLANSAIAYLSNSVLCLADDPSVKFGDLE